MVEVHPLYPRKWEPSDPLVAYNNADGQVVASKTMSRGNSSYYDRYGYQGCQGIVCIDCKQDGRDVPVILVEAEHRRRHFRHKQGEAPDGLGRHGETAEHMRGKQLITDWARNQHQVLPWSVVEEFWVTGIRLRSDVKANVASGQQIAFEIQRRPMERKDWDRRHGGYESGGVRDVWLWSPDVPDLVLDLPLTSVVLDMEQESIGILVANYAGRYRHPTAEKHLRLPTHYASAPLSEWSISISGALVPPPSLEEYIGDRPDSARLAQLRTNRQAETTAPEAPSRRPPEAYFQQQRQVSSHLYERGTNVAEDQRIDDAIARIFGRNR